MIPAFGVIGRDGEGRGGGSSALPTSVVGGGDSAPAEKSPGIGGASSEAREVGGLPVSFCFQLNIELRIERELSCGVGCVMSVSSDADADGGFSSGGGGSWGTGKGGAVGSSGEGCTRAICFARSRAASSAACL